MNHLKTSLEFLLAESADSPYEIDQTPEGMISYYNQWWAQFYEDFRKRNPALKRLTEPLKGWRLDPAQTPYHFSWRKRSLAPPTHPSLEYLRFVFEINCTPFRDEGRGDTMVCSAWSTVMDQRNPDDWGDDKGYKMTIENLSRRLMGLRRDEFETRLAQILLESFFTMLQKILFGLIGEGHIKSLDDSRFFIGDDLSWYPGGLPALEKALKSVSTRARMF